ncbi:MAG: hypothetical protein AB8C84_07290 [Oligoflexales bacterium]
MLQKKKQYLLSFCFCLLSVHSYAAVHLTIRGNATDNNIGLVGQQSRDLSSSVAFDLGNYFRLGLTHREATTHKIGYESSTSDDTDTVTYQPINNFTRVSSNSFDLTVILYYGKLWVPYVMVGVVKKSYETQFLTSEGETTAFRTPTPALPNAGCGVGFRLNKAFTLKLSYTASPGLKIDDPTTADAKPRAARDSYTSVGISYNI